MNQVIKLDTRKREGKYGEARIAPRAEPSATTRC